MKAGDQNLLNSPVRVLVVEDNLDDSDLLVRQLHGSHFEGHVKIISDGGAAWNFLVAEESTSSLIAIFLDLTLPSTCALKLLRKIKSRPQLEDIPIIVMVSSHHSADLQECDRLGVDAYVAKPVTYGAFTMAVADIFHAPPVQTLMRPE